MNDTLNVIMQILVQITWSEESLGEGVRANRKMIDEELKRLDPTYNSQEFWTKLEENVLINKGLFSK